MKYNKIFVCGWHESSPKGHMEWPKSTVYHATGECLSGLTFTRRADGSFLNKEKGRLELMVENYGLSASKSKIVRVV